MTSTLKAEQRRRLEETTGWARKIREVLDPVLRAHGERVHFRPASKGIAMISLGHELPQRGKSGIRDLEDLAAKFEARFSEHCLGIEQGKETGEKALQSFLIRDAARSRRRVAAINTASQSTNDPVELVFITDEIALPLADNGKMVCDVLALRRDRGRCTPVVLELKDARAMTRLIEQVDGYAALIEEHRDLFADLFSAVLGETVRFDGRPTEKWIVWPRAGEGKDPREEELGAKGIRVVGYDKRGAGEYGMRVGNAPSKRPAYVLAGPASDPPTTRCYWVVPGQFLAGAYPGHADRPQHEARVASLWNAGVRMFVSLMEEAETNASGKAFTDYAATVAALAERAGERGECVRFAIRDVSVPSPEIMRAVLDAIDEALAAGRPVFVHCWGGIGRTGTVVGCWMLRHGLATQEDVLATLARLRVKDVERAAKISPETEDQRQFVVGWSGDIQSGSKAE